MAPRLPATTKRLRPAVQRADLVPDLGRRPASAGLELLVLRDAHTELRAARPADQPARRRSSSSNPGNIATGSARLSWRREEGAFLRIECGDLVNNPSSAADNACDRQCSGSPRIEHLPLAVRQQAVVAKLREPPSEFGDPDEFPLRRMRRPGEEVAPDLVPASLDDVARSVTSRICTTEHNGPG